NGPTKEREDCLKLPPVHITLIWFLTANSITILMEFVMTVSGMFGNSFAKNHEVELASSNMLSSSLINSSTISAIFFFSHSFSFLIKFYSNLGFFFFFRYLFCFSFKKRSVYLFLLYRYSSPMGSY